MITSYLDSLGAAAKGVDGRLHDRDCVERTVSIFVITYPFKST